MEGGDGSGLKGDGGVGLFELGPALGELSAEVGETAVRMRARACCLQVRD